MMRIVPSCEKCLYDKRVAIAGTIADEKKRQEFLKEIRSLLDNRAPGDSAPYMVYLFGQVQKRFGISDSFYPKEQYNSLLLSMEESIEAKIEASTDPLEKSIVYARIGNYIDFGAMNTVDTDIFLAMLDRESKTGLDKGVYEQFLADCEKAKTFVLLCDNCGEIVLDKLFVRQLRKRFPHLEITVMVRGENVLNDATLEDAVFCGMDKEAATIGNGNGVAGTVPELLSKEALSCIENADVIFAKGQGNYETFAGYPKTVYYTFLCKCDWFTKRFNVSRLTGMFLRESGQ